MKIKITEKQLSEIVNKLESLTEDDLGDSTTTTTSTSAEDFPAYPEVGHWESGVTRGPANQIGNTKWSDVVGSTLKRGKANPLK